MFAALAAGNSGDPSEYEGSFSATLDNPAPFYLTVGARYGTRPLVVYFLFLFFEFMFFYEGRKPDYLRHLKSLTSPPKVL